MVTEGGDSGDSDLRSSVNERENLNKIIQRPSRNSKSGTDLGTLVAEALGKATEFLFSVQRDDLFWCAELESNSTITAEYVFLCQILGVRLENEREKLIRYLVSRQNADGSWSIAEGVEGNVSSTAETYLALRILGLEQDCPRLLRAESFIRKGGGLENLRVFTRIFFALFGLIPWSTVPTIPTEFILFPQRFPINIYSIASWARSTMIPLFIIFHHQPVYSLPNGRFLDNTWLDHLWLDPRKKKEAYASSLLDLIFEHRVSWKSFFGITDYFLKLYEQVRIQALRQRALEECTQWILERQENSGDWGGIFPPMMNGVIALTLQGYSLESEPVKKGLEAIRSFSWEDPDGLRIQACVSPVWDTALCAIALVDSKVSKNHPRLQGAIQWILDRQLLVDYGDWKIYRPNLNSGGWPFEYHNSWYPDIDDTAAVILSLLKQNPKLVYDERLSRSLNWVLGMQNEDGGWAAFDVNNDNQFLNDIPFSDMNSLCDPSTADVTGRVLEACGLFRSILAQSSKIYPADQLYDFPKDLDHRVRMASEAGVRYLRSTQEKEGSWFGRWGVNYIYGTSNVLCGLAEIKMTISDPMVRRGVGWLVKVQNEDGGWGESVDSYLDKKKMGCGKSTASQTAWALMALLGHLPSSSPAIEKGIHWLLCKQKPGDARAAYEAGKLLPKARGCSWEDDYFTGTGFPNYFYLKYHLYSHYFPMMALGRYLKTLEN